MPLVALFQARIRELLAQPLATDAHGCLTPAVLDLSPQARAEWIRFHDEVERELGAQALAAQLVHRGDQRLELCGVVEVGHFVAELVQHQALALFLHMQGKITGAFHAGRLRHLNQGGAIGGHGVLALLTHMVRHDQDHFVTLHGRNHGQGNTGIATGGFNQRITRMNLSFFFRPADHVQRRPVFDRTRRVVALKLSEDNVATFFILGSPYALQCRQGRFANGVFDGWVFHRPTLCHNSRLRLKRRKFLPSKNAVSGSWRGRRAQD